MQKHHRFGCDLLGVMDAGTLTSALKNASDARAQMITLTLVLGAHEADLGVHTWAEPKHPCCGTVPVTDQRMGLRALGDRTVRDQGRLRRRCFRSDKPLRHLRHSDYSNGLKLRLHNCSIAMSQETGESFPTKTAPRTSSLYAKTFGSCRTTRYVTVPTRNATSTVCGSSPKPTGRQRRSCCQLITD